MPALPGTSGNINFLLVTTESGKILFRKSLINFSVLIMILVKCIFVIGYSKVFGEKSCGVFLSVSLVHSKLHIISFLRKSGEQRFVSPTDLTQYTDNHKTSITGTYKR